MWIGPASRGGAPMTAPVNPAIDRAIVPTTGLTWALVLNQAIAHPLGRARALGLRAIEGGRLLGPLNKNDNPREPLAFLGTASTVGHAPSP